MAFNGKEIPAAHPMDLENGSGIFSPS